MKIIDCLLLCVVISITDFIGTLTKVDSSQLERKIFNAIEPPSDGRYTYMASLQVNDVHICGAGMFRTGFLISSGECINEVQKGVNDKWQEAYAVLGHQSLERGVKHIILDTILHPNFKVDKPLRLTWNYDVGVVMVEVTEYLSKLPIVPLSVKMHSARTPLDGTLCGWGGRTATEKSSSSLHCIRVSIYGQSLCRKPRLNMDFVNKLICGSGHPGQNITFADYGSPLTMFLVENWQPINYIIGITSGYYQKDKQYLIRFVRSNFVHETIDEMVDKLNYAAGLSAFCKSTSQTISIRREHKRLKTSE